MATIAEIIEKLKANVPFEKLSTLQTLLRLYNLCVLNREVTRLVEAL